MTDTAMTDLLATLEGKLTEDQLAQAREWLVPAPVVERELTLEERALVAELQAANAAAREADKRKTRAQAELTRALGQDLQAGTHDGVVILRRTHQERGTVDRTLLREAFPEAAERCTVAVPVVFWSAK